MTLTLYVLRTVAGALVKPMSLMVLVFIGVMFYRQNRKITLMQKMVVGKKLNSPLELTLSQIVIGIFGAVLASLMMAYLGITFSEDSMINLIFVFSIILMFIKPRFICFSYSGAMLGGLSIILRELSIILNRPSLDVFKIDIIPLMAMVAVLHFVEGLMIILDGKRGAIPVFTNREGKIFGGFVLKRYWLLPVAILFILNSNSLEGIRISMPQWWGIFNKNFPLNMLKDVVIGSIAFYGIVGYESVTFTKTREKKAVDSGVWVIIYSILLFILSQICSINRSLELFLLIFAPLGHEFMIFMQKYGEIKNKSIYVSGDDGMMVLEVAPDSLAYNMGIRSGDLLMNINNKKIEGESDILNVIRDAPNYIKLSARKISGEIKELKYDNMVNRGDLGAVFVPKTIEKDSDKIVKVKEKNFKEILEEAKKEK